jgi:hypothetical protein
MDDRSSKNKKAYSQAAFVAEAQVYVYSKSSHNQKIGLKLPHFQAKVGKWRSTGRITVFGRVEFPNVREETIPAAISPEVDRRTRRPYRRNGSRTDPR